MCPHQEQEIHHTIWTHRGRERDARKTLNRKQTAEIANGKRQSCKSDSFCSHETHDDNTSYCGMERRNSIVNSLQGWQSQIRFMFIIHEKNICIFDISRHDGASGDEIVHFIAATTRLPPDEHPNTPKRKQTAEKRNSISARVRPRFCSSFSFIKYTFLCMYVYWCGLMMDRSASAV